MLLPLLVCIRVCWGLNILESISDQGSSFFIFKNECMHVIPRQVSHMSVVVAVVPVATYICYCSCVCNRGGAAVIAVRLSAVML